MPQIKSLLGGRTSYYLSGLTFRWEPGLITVEFVNERRQEIKYWLDDEYYFFSSRVARRGLVERIGRDRVAKEILLRNRVTDVVSFRFTRDGAVEGIIEQRASSLQAEELRFYLATLAREADRFEFFLTGRDIH